MVIISTTSSCLFLLLTQISSDDIFIAVMGITGSGKSSFVNLLVADDVAVGHTLEPCKTISF